MAAVWLYSSHFMRTSAGSHSMSTTQATISSTPRMTLTIGGLFHLLHDGIADGLAVFLPLWQTAFGLSLTQVGLLVTCFEGATGIFQIPAGFLGERYGERRLLGIGTLITTASFMCLGLAGGVVSLVAFLMIGGLGASVQHPLASSMVSRAYEHKGRRLALGSYNFAGDIGKFIFPALAAVMLTRYGWRPVCVGVGLFGCVLTIVLMLLLAKWHIGGAPMGEKGKEKEHSSQKGWGIVNKRAFATLSAIAIVDTAVRVGLIVFAPFLLITKGVQAESVGYALSLLFIGGAVGKFVCGAIAERIGIIATVVITECITGVGILLLTVLPLTGIYYLLPLLGAGLNGTSSVLYGTVADFVQPRKVSRAFGLFYTFVIASSAMAPPIMGRISDMIGVDQSMRLIACVALITVVLAGILSRQMKT